MARGRSRTIAPDFPEFGPPGSWRSISPIAFSLRTMVRREAAAASASWRALTDTRTPPSTSSPCRRASLRAATVMLYSVLPLCPFHSRPSSVASISPSALTVVASGSRRVGRHGSLP